MNFDISGVEIEAVLNCGDTVNLDEKNITVLTGGKLAAGTESIKIAFTKYCLINIFSKFIRACGGGNNGFCKVILFLSIAFKRRESNGSMSID